jgi:hypothetical protein
MNAKYNWSADVLTTPMPAVRLISAGPHVSGQNGSWAELMESHQAAEQSETK